MGFILGFIVGAVVVWYKDPIVAWIKSKLPW
jgi:hypothetical protein